MMKLLLGLAIVLTWHQSISQYCTSGGPTQTIDSNLEWLTMTGESGGINYTGCPGLIGVEFHSSETVFIDAGSSYSINLQFGTCGGTFSGVGEAWIDFNGNQLFEVTESIGTWQGTPPTAASLFNFTVPGASTTGLTRMRVVHHEGGTLPIDPCASFAWGSATDFNVYIQNGIDCSAYTGDNSNDPREVTSLPFTENYSTAYCYTNQNNVYPSPDIFYKVKVPAGVSSLKASLCGSTFDTFLTALKKDGSVIDINDDSPSCNTQSELEIPVSGLDSVYFIVEGWGVQSGDYTINIGEGTLGQTTIDPLDIQIYPNPAKDFVIVNSSKSLHATLVDNQGRVVQSFELDQSINHVDLNDFDSGSYFLIVTDHFSVFTYKIVKR